MSIAVAIFRLDISTRTSFAILPAGPLYKTCLACQLLRCETLLKQQKREAERLRQLNAPETDSDAEESSTMPADPEVFAASLETAMNLATV
jgi:hypothetical protein